MPIHSFSIELATKYGTDKAIILHNLAYWQKNNKANETNFFEGKYWTYNSAKAFSEIFPYFSEDKVKRLLRDMEKSDKSIVSGNFNKRPFDRTKWYSVICQDALCIYALCDGADLPNGSGESARPIPDINQIKNNIYHEGDDLEEDSRVRSPEDVQKKPEGFTKTIIEILEKKANRKFSSDPRWLTRFRNDLGSLLDELEYDHERILNVLEWYGKNKDCFITIDSGFTLKDKFSKLERMMNIKKDDTDERREKICSPPGIVKASPNKPWRCSCGVLNSVIDEKCECGKCKGA